MSRTHQRPLGLTFNLIVWTIRLLLISYVWNNLTFYIPLWLNVFMTFAPNYAEPCVVENPANSLFWETKCGAKGYTLSMATHSCIRHAPTVR